MQRQYIDNQTEIEVNPDELTCKKLSNQTDLSTLDASQLLYELFEQNKNIYFYQNYLKKNNSFYFLTRSRCKIKLTHSILRRPSESRPDEYRFEVIGDILGEGGCAKVYSVARTLKLDDLNKVVIPKKNSDDISRVIKIIPASICSEPLEVTQKRLRIEAELSKKIDTLHTKTPVETTSHLFLVMRRLHGKILDHFIFEDDSPNKLSHPYNNMSLPFGWSTTLRNFSPESRFKITIKIIRAIQSLHDLDIIHRDFTPANIMMEYNSHVRITPFDLGLSKKANENEKGNYLGSNLFYAPLEILSNENTTSKSDDFFLGKIIGLLWGLLFLRLFEDVEKNRSSFLKCVDTDTLFNEDLYHQINIDPSIKEKIYDIVKQLTRANHEERLSNDEALARFEKAKISYRISQHQQHDLDDALIQANENGLTFRKAMRENRNKFCKEQIINLMEIYLDKLNPHPDVIQEFIDVLGIEALEGLQSKQAIYQKIHGLFEDFNELTSQFKLLFEKMDCIPNDSSLKKKITSALKKCDQPITNLDKLATLVADLKKKYQEICPDDHEKLLQTKRELFILHPSSKETMLSISLFSKSKETIETNPPLALSQNSSSIKI